MKNCQNCGHKNGDSVKFCTECGTKLVEISPRCPGCGAEIKQKAKFCRYCGYNLVTGVQASNDAAETIDGTKVQKIFAQLRADEFIDSQVIRERWDREERNGRYSASFKAAFDSILKEDFAGAKKHCKDLRKKPFKWLLYAEIEWHCGIYKKALPPAESLALAFGIAEKRFEKFVQKAHEKLPLNRFAQKSYAAFASVVSGEETYRTLPVRNIAVCATMSAGKSTFVNALLGHDVLPARNEATTAKVTSVYDKDGAARIVGFVHDRPGHCADLCGDVRLSAIDEWNASPDVSRIFLQGDLDGIGNNGIIAAMHDTPGTNNSGDKSHHDVTFDFLAKNKMDALVYVANAEHLGTTDEKALLSELREETKKGGIPVIFVLNKADNIDTEKESLDAVIAGYREFLSGIGFADAKIFPVSSKAARLLKMAIKGRGDSFTESECDAFPLIAKKFTKRLVLDDGGSNESIAVEGQTLVDGEAYETASLQTALFHTGINKIEKELEAIVR